MSTQGALRDYVLNIEPGAEQLIQAIGNYFNVIDAAGGRVKVSTSRGDAFDVEEGQGARVRDFESLRVRNESGVTLRVRMLAGTGDFQSVRTTGSVSPKPAGSFVAVGDIAGGGTIPANADRREIIMRAKTDNVGALTVAGLPLEPGDALTLDVTGSVAVSGDAGDILHVAEVV
ncbi:hypothetical protein QLQ85_08840 [Halomonas sp. M4R5S39]|uniref:hypothetical protein n=1 Tax=Halomonas kalidii TaxID=3043293 RepID=UPI0024A98A2D|nr:hypothetical protein [Halomonas kalidii]MDI5984896.1 hypothetical protein [Halomonas kalidii]